MFDDADEYGGSFNDDGSCENLTEDPVRCLLDYGSDVSTCFSSEDGSGPAAWANMWLATAGLERRVESIQGAKYHSSSAEYCVSFKPTEVDGEVECPEHDVECLAR